MIKVSRLILIFGVASLLGCQPKSDSLTDAEKANIVKEVKRLGAELAAAAEATDVDGIISHFRETEDAWLGLGGGTGYNLDELKTAASQTHERLERQEFMIDDWRYLVASRQCVVASGKGKVTAFHKDGSEGTSGYGVTLVWTKSADAWKIGHMHQSFDSRP